MGFKENLIGKIIDLEWEMFQRVQGKDGPANCQQDRPSFEVMRRSQALSWSETVLESYLKDLKSAGAAKRNLIEEKYAHMMASTAPLEYAELSPFLPKIEPQKKALIENIVKLILEWELALGKAYPHIIKRGRPLLASEDGSGVTSLETYLRGELKTYTKRTLDLYWAHIQRQKAAGINGARITLEYIVSCYGYSSIEAAEKAMMTS